MKIVLIGFMGSGKTSVAQLLAEKLNLQFIDMDDLILKSSEFKSINEIFEKRGETEFRKMEMKIAEEIAQEDNIVISTGGGVVMNEKTMSYLTTNSKIIFLNLSFEKAKQRVHLKKILPPLFQNIFDAKKLFEKRMPLYLKYADITIDTDNKNIDNIIKEVVVKIKEN